PSSTATIPTSGPIVYTSSALAPPSAPSTRAAGAVALDALGDAVPLEWHRAAAGRLAQPQPNPPRPGGGPQQAAKRPAGGQVATRPFRARVVLLVQVHQRVIGVIAHLCAQRGGRLDALRVGAFDDHIGVVAPQIYRRHVGARRAVRNGEYLFV